MNLEFNHGDVVQAILPSGKVVNAQVVGYNLKTHEYVVEWDNWGDIEETDLPASRITLW